MTSALNRMKYRSIAETWSRLASAHTRRYVYRSRTVQAPAKQTVEKEDCSTPLTQESID